MTDPGAAPDERSAGTRVTCLDLSTNDVESELIRDDYMLITDGSCYLASAQTHANGTHVLVVKGRKEPAR